MLPQDYQRPEVFRAAREAHELSQTNWAIVLGRGHYSSIARYESGAHPIELPLARLVWFIMKYGIPKEFK